MDICIADKISKIIIMKKLFLITILMLSAGLLMAQTEDQDAIKKVIQTSYVEGIQNEGDPDKIDAGFHPGFRLLGVGKGNEMWELPIYTWKERASNEVAEGKKPRKAEEAVSVKFLDVDVTGNAAVVKLEFYVGEKLTFIDYISLYKFGEEWKIVSKIFYRLPEEE
jgi:hypothetical protein